MLLMTNEEIIGLGDFQESIMGSTHNKDESEQVLKLSLCTMVGLTTKKYQKLWCSIG